MSSVIFPTKLLPVCARVLKFSSYSVTKEPLVNGPFWDTPATVFSVMAMAFSASDVPPAFLSSDEQETAKKRVLNNRANV